MAAPETYSVSDFLKFLKLGIWNRGFVKDWGFIENIKPGSDGYAKNDCFIKRLPHEYLDKGWCFKKQLGIGLYCHDLYPLYAQVDGYSRICTHMLVISECRLNGVFEERVYYLKVTNRDALSEFRELIFGKFSPPDRRKLRGPFDRIRPKSRYDSGHLSPHRRF